MHHPTFTYSAYLNGTLPPFWVRRVENEQGFMDALFNSVKYLLVSLSQRQSSHYTSATPQNLGDFRVRNQEPVAILAPDMSSKGRQAITV